MLALAAGCATDSPPVPVPIDDHSAPVLSARLLWRLPGDPESMRGHARVELDYARRDGSASQVLRSGEKIVLGGIVNGPQPVEHRLETRYRHAAFNYLLPAGRGLFGHGLIELEFLVGTGFADLALHSQGSTSSAPMLERDWRLGGLVLGVAPRWRFGAYVALEARATSLIAFPAPFAETWRSFDVGLAYRPARMLAIRAGYSDTLAEVIDPLGIESRLTARLRGPYLGVTLDF